MKDQQKLIIAILLLDNKINQSQYNEAITILETLAPAEIAKLNWISKKFQLAKDDIMSAYQKSKELSSKHGSPQDAFNSLDLHIQQTTAQPKSTVAGKDNSKSTNEKRLTESEISIKKGPTRLSMKSSYQTDQNFSKIKHKPKLRVQQTLNNPSSRFIDLEVSEAGGSSKDEGLFKSAENKRPLSDIESPNEPKLKLKRSASKIIEPKSEFKLNENLILEAPPSIEEKQKKAFEIEQIQSLPQTADGEVLNPPPPILPTSNIINPPTKLNSIEGYDDIELEKIDDLEEIDDFEEINSTPPMLKSSTDDEIVELSDDEIDEIEPDNSKTKSNRLRPRSRKHRRR